MHFFSAEYRLTRLVGLASILALALASGAGAVSLRGTRASLDRQNLEAQRHDFTFIRDRSHLNWFLERGLLVAARGNSNYALDEVSYPYTRPAVKLFIERLSQQYRTACSEQLVVTSLTRPKRYQPHNASPRSVHPTGMALDLRRPKRGTCRRWLEDVLLSLEGQGVLEATLERRPPHYHVALYPKQYKAYVARLVNANSAEQTYRVASGDTLWNIARRHRTTVEKVQAANGLSSSRILPGQLLKLPASR